MRTRILVTSALALAATFTSASALTVTNSDKIAHEFMVKPSGGKQQSVVLKASATGTFDCAKGCELRMGAKKVGYTAKVDRVWIKGGNFTTIM